MGTIWFEEGSVFVVAWIAWMRSSMFKIVGMENMVSIFILIADTMGNVLPVIYCRRQKKSNGGVC